MEKPYRITIFRENKAGEDRAEEMVDSSWAHYTTEEQARKAFYDLTNRLYALEREEQKNA